jgi:hypothetical protein
LRRRVHLLAGEQSYVFGLYYNCMIAVPKLHTLQYGLTQ